MKTYGLLQGRFSSSLTVGSFILDLFMFDFVRIYGLRSVVEDEWVFLIFFCNG
jgi:hypothetical protein